MNKNVPVAMNFRNCISIRLSKKARTHAAKARPLVPYHCNYSTAEASKEHQQASTRKAM
jgi:hypothetical protein